MTNKEAIVVLESVIICDEDVELYNAIQLAIKSLKADRPKAEWEYVWAQHTPHNVCIGYMCSNCGNFVDGKNYDFCPNCGADMRGEA